MMGLQDAASGLQRRLGSSSSLLWATPLGFNPATLFRNGEQGWFYDLSDMSTLFQDAAGITPVTDVNQPVGLQLDKSKGLVLGPELVTNGDFSNGATGWSAETGITIAGGVANFNTTTNAFLIQNISITANTLYEVTLNVVSYVRGSPFVLLGASGALSSVTIPSPSVLGQKKIKVLAAAGTSGFRIGGVFGTGWEGSIDNISVRQLPGNHRSQSASLPRPTYARHPLGGIRNLLLNTGFDGAVSGSPGTAPTDWTRFIGATGGTSTYTAGAGSLGGGSLRISVAADRHQIGQTISVAANTTYVLSAIVDITTPTGLTQILDWVNPPAGSIFAWRVNGGAIITNGNTVPSAGNNQLIEAILTVSATAGTANARFGVGIQANVTGDVTFRDIQVDVASVRSAYQRVGSAFDVTEAGVPDLYYLSYDGLNDSLSTAPFAWGSDKATICAGVRKLSDAAGAIFAEFSPNAGSNQGSWYLSAPDSAPSPYGTLSRGSAVITGTMRADITSSGAAPDTAVITAIHDIAGDLSRIRRNGVAGTDGTADKGTGNFGTYPAFFGARAGTSAFFKGWEYSNVGISRLLTTGELAALESWTAGKAGNTL